MCSKEEGIARSKKTHPRGSTCVAVSQRHGGYIQRCFKVRMEMDGRDEAVVDRLVVGVLWVCRIECMWVLGEGGLQ